MNECRHYRLYIITLKSKNQNQSVLMGYESFILNEGHFGKN